MATVNGLEILTYPVMFNLLKRYNGFRIHDRSVSESRGGDVVKQADPPNLQNPVTLTV